MEQNNQAASPDLDGAVQLLITVHGIRTFGQWQERLEQLVLSEATSTRAVHYKYGYFSILAFVVPFLRWIVTRRFRRALLALLKRHPGIPIHIVAHSFGTHVVAWALWDLRNEPLCRIQTVVLAGSVLKSNFPWNALLDRGVIQRLLNECGTQDNVLLLNQVAVLFTGMAGRIGFNGFLNHRFANHFHAFGHSDYFVSNGSPSNSFMARRWVPLLTDGRMPASVDERSPSAAAGVITFVAQNAEPIKVFAYSSPLIALSMVLFFLYANAEEQRRLASSRAKAAEAQLLLTTDELQLGPAAQLAIDATVDLRDTRLSTLRRRFSHVLGDRFAEPSNLSSNLIYTVRSAVSLLPLNRHTEFFPDNNNLDAVTPSVAFALRHRQSSVRLNLIDTSQSYDPSADGEDSRTRFYTLDLYTARVTHATPSRSGQPAQEGADHAVSADGEYTATLSGDRVEVVHRGDHDVKRALDQLEQPADPMFSPNNRYLAWRTEQKTGDPLAGKVCIWEFGTYAEPKCSPQPDAVNALAFSPDESMIAVALGASPDGSGGYKESVADAAVLFSTESFDVLQTLKHRARVTGVSFNPAGNRIASLSEDHTVKVWSTESGRELRRVVGNGELVSADFLPDGRLLTLSEHEARLDDVAGESLGELGDPHSEPTRFAFNHAGTQLAVAYKDNLQIWNVHPVRLGANIPYPITKQESDRHKSKAPVISKTQNDEENLFLQLKSDTDKEVETQRDEELLHSTSLSFSSDDTCIAVEQSTLEGGRQKFAWSLPGFTRTPKCNGARIASLEGVAGSFRVEATSPAYKEMRSINVMSAKSGDIVSEYALASYVNGDDRLNGGGFGLSPNGNSFATVVGDHLKVVVHDLTSGREYSFLSPRQFVAISFSPDSRYLALGEIEGTVNIVDMRSMREIDRFIDPEGVTALQFDTTGHTLAVAHTKLLTLYELNLQTLADGACAVRLRCPTQ